MSYSAMLDTNIISALMRDREGRLQRRVGEYGVENLCTSIVVACELRFSAVQRSSERVSSMVDGALASIAILPLEPPVDAFYGRVRTHLASLGKPIGPNDVFIAAHALSLGLKLITANVREFSRVPGLVVENWLD